MTFYIICVKLLTRLSHLLTYRAVARSNLKLGCLSLRSDGARLLYETCPTVLSCTPQ